jgi:hypothetical protein
MTGGWRAAGPASSAIAIARDAFVASRKRNGFDPRSVVRNDLRS